MNRNFPNPVDLHEFGVRRAVRMAAARSGVDFRAAERAAMRHLREYGQRSDALFVGLDLVCPAPELNEVF